MKYRSHIIDTNKHWKRSKKPPKKKEKKSFEEDIYIRIFVEKFLRIANCKSEGKELMEDRFGRGSQKVSGIRT